MTLLWQDGFNHYGVSDEGRLNMLDGPWAQVDGGATLAAPSFGAGTQDNSLRLPNGLVVTSVARRVLPATKLTLIVAARIYMEELPSTSNTAARAFVFADGSNNAMFFLCIGTTGTMALYSADGTAPGSPNALLLQTTSPVFQSGTWTHIEAKIHIDAVGGTFELRVNEQAVLTGASMDLGSTPVAQIRVERGGEVLGGSSSLWFNDMTTKDTAGTLNEDFEGDIRVFTMFPNADTDVAGWTPFPRERFGTGILDLTTSRACALVANSSTQLDLGSADFTLEGQVRFFAMPTGSDKSVVLSKWGENTNQREWEFYVGGPSLESGNTVFRISTDGQSGTVQEIISYPVTWELNTWYHWALVRNAAETILYVDGVQQGMPIADTNTYHAASAKFTVGCELLGDGSSVIDHTGFTGFMDEVRVTPGIARYTTEFTPPVAAFPRDVSGDPDFLNVSYLAGFDNDLQDESSFGRLMTQMWIEGSDGHGARPVQLTPNDAPQAYKTINEHTPIDDNFIQASFLPATGIYTLTAAAANNETVTLGSTVYTFKTTLSGAANEVLRGLTNLTALFNLYSAVNKLSGEGTLYGTGTVINPDAQFTQLPGDQLEAIASVLGTAGNSVVTTETTANGSWSHATLTGGVDIPGPSEFSVNHPPNDTTQLKALTIVHRSYKTDSGACKLQTSLVGAEGASLDGLERFVGVNPTYYEDVFEVDPDTSLGLTPTTIIGGRIRINRTE